MRYVISFASTDCDINDTCWHTCFPSQLCIQQLNPEVLGGCAFFWLAKPGDADLFLDDPGHLQRSQPQQHNPQIQHKHFFFPVKA